MPNWIGGLSPRLVGLGIESTPRWIGGVSPRLVGLGD